MYVRFVLFLFHCISLSYIVIFMMDCRLIYPKNDPLTIVIIIYLLIFYRTLLKFCCYVDLLCTQMYHNKYHKNYPRNRVIFIKNTMYCLGKIWHMYQNLVQKLPNGITENYPWWVIFPYYP